MIVFDGSIDIYDELVIVFDGSIDIEGKDDVELLLILELPMSVNDIIGVNVLSLDRIGLDETVLV